MRPYYLTKNSYGYYLVSFTNKETGLRTPYKSTHTKDYSEAITIAMKWFTEGVPSENVIRAKRQKESECKINIDNLLTRLSEVEAKTLYDKIAAQFGFGVPVVQTPVPVPIAAPAETTTVIPKKNALSDSGLLPEDVAQKLYEPLNPECKMNLCEFLQNFWTPEKSEYIKNKRAHNKPIGDYHCKEMFNMVDRYWKPFFGEEFTVGQLTEQYLEDFLQELANFRHLKGATINHARTCGATGLKWLKNKGLIHSNPMANVEAFSKSDSVARGIPSEREIKELYELTWDSEVMYLAFNLSAFSGLRPGEISGLQVRDIDSETDLLTIRHSWHRTGFLKSTKTNLIRKVPVAHNIIIRLLAQAQLCPKFGDESFVCWSNVMIDKPYLPQYYDDGFFEALHKIGVSEEERRERNIDFYSLRHFCATYLANMTDMRNVQAVLGHSTPAMTSHYANHMTDEHMDTIREIFEQSRMSILAA